MSNIKTKTIKTSSTVCDKNDYYVIGFSNSVTFMLLLIELTTCFLLCWYNLSVHIIILSLNSSFLYVKMLFLMHFLLQVSVSHACNAWQQTATLTYTADSQSPLLLCSLFFRTKVKKKWRMKSVSLISLGFVGSSLLVKENTLTRNVKIFPAAKN